MLSMNFTPVTIFGNWWLSRRRHPFLGCLCELEDHGERRLVSRGILGAYGLMPHGGECACNGVCGPQGPTASLANAGGALEPHALADPWPVDRVVPSHLRLDRHRHFRLP
jgi:hypothetical protein